MSAKSGRSLPDKIRRYELTDKTFVVTYIDKAAKPTAVIRWRR